MFSHNGLSVEEACGARRGGIGANSWAASRTAFAGGCGGEAAWRSRGHGGRMAIHIKMEFTGAG
eukprot:5839504-Pleurochrysis_carterae.AAC.1